MSVNLSLVLPCYNEEKNIPILYKEFLEISFQGVVSELIFVNNGSTDKTGFEIDKIIEINNLKQSSIIVKKVDLIKNEGYGGGIAAGLKEAIGQYIGWSHADLQTPLVDFFKLYQLVKNKGKVFGKGRRINNRGFHGIISSFHEKLASLILGYNMKEINAQPKIFSREVINYFENMPKKWTTLDTYANYVCLINDIEIVEIEVIFKTRVHGESKWQNNFWIFVKHIFFNLIYLFQLRLSKIKK